MEDKHGKSFVGTVSNFRQRKGWFFGAFADDPLLNSDLVEVAWQQLSNVEPTSDDAHYHAKSVEINIVLKGDIHLTIDGVRHHLEAGQFYVIWSHSVVSDVSTGADTELIVVRAPSIPEDKVLVKAT
jgi:mannose-6-phosphate isomerase-like protein (cupin superfamily)